MEEVNFTQVVRRGCGIDIHRDIAVATIGGERELKGLGYEVTLSKATA